MEGSLFSPFFTHVIPTPARLLPLPLSCPFPCPHTLPCDEQVEDLELELRLAQQKIKFMDGLMEARRDTIKKLCARGQTRNDTAAVADDDA